MAKAHTIVDTFDDNAVNGAVWAWYGSIQETNQRLEITPAAWTNDTWSGYYTPALYDLTNSSFSLEVAQVLNHQQDAFTYLEIKYNHQQDQRLTIELMNGTLYAYYSSGGVWTNAAQVPYDAWAHRWWRIRESWGTTYWETSADGCWWATIAQVPTSIPAHAVSLGFGAGTWPALPDPGMAIFDNVNARAVDPFPNRRQQAFALRVQAAQIAHDRPHPRHANNREECDYPLVASYSKALPHDGCGIVDPGAYNQLLAAVSTGDPAQFEAIPLGGMLKLTNPQGGLAFDLEGPDPAAVTIPPAPRIDSPQNSSEAAELYWMALARDVYFGDYAWDGRVQAAIQSLNTEFSDFRGPKENGQVTTQTVFRGIYPGETVGPYVSQFLLKGTSDPRLPAGQGQCATEGLITYGELKIDQRQVTVVPGTDYLTTFGDWLDVQNGWDRRGQDAVDTSGRRFIRNLRDLGERVHIDNVVDHFYNAAHILLNEVPGDQRCGSGRVAVDRQFRDDPGNPYTPPAPESATQTGFVTFGAPHAITLVTEVLTRALQAVWFQKWFIHRRLRPEEFGGRLEAMLRYGCGPYPIDSEIVASLTGGLLQSHYFAHFNTYLLAQQYPEGAPTHPSYGSGHATGAGACATILKAFFDDLQPIESPVVSDPSGTVLIDYTGGDAWQMTVGGELNKLAGNVAIGRNSAGVHWRTDYDQSLLLGEAVALGILQEQSIRYNENQAGAYFELTRFDGTRVRIQNGAVFPV